MAHRIDVLVEFYMLHLSWQLEKFVVSKFAFVDYIIHKEYDTTKSRFGYLVLENEHQDARRNFKFDDFLVIFGFY